MYITTEKQKNIRKQSKQTKTITLAQMTQERFENGIFIVVLT